MKISAFSWFYYKEIWYDARSHERKINEGVLTTLVSSSVKIISAFTYHKFNFYVHKCLPLDHTLS